MKIALTILVIWGAILFLTICYSRGCEDEKAQDRSAKVAATMILPFIFYVVGVIIAAIFKYL